MLLPNAGLVCTGGSSTLAMTTTGLLMSLWTAVADGYSDDINIAEVQADLTNNRILVAAPGVYKVECELYITSGASVDYYLQVRKNGVAQANLLARQYVVTSTGTYRIGLSGFMKVTSANNPKTIPATGSSSSYMGVGAQAKVMVPVDVVLYVGSSTDTVTVQEGHFNVLRVA